MRKAFCTVENAVLALDSLVLTGAKDLTPSDTVAMFTETCSLLRGLQRLAKVGKQHVHFV